MRLSLFAALLGTTALVPFAAMAQSSSPTQQPNQQGQTAQQGQQQGQATASQLRSQPIYTTSGQQIGRVTAVVQGQDNRTQAVVNAGDRQVLAPTDRIAYQNNRFVLSGYTDEQVRQLPAYDQRTSSQYREADPNYRIAIVGFVIDPAATSRQAAQDRQQTNQQQADASRIVVQQPAPTIRVDQASPQVTVQQPQPNVTVFQPQPEIIVRQPQPTVTVNIPQPEIIVRMPQPDVNVAMAQPQVRVNQPQPQIQVQRNNQEPQVQVERDQAQVRVIPPQSQANVQVQRNAGEPQVRYEAAEPRVVVSRQQGEPNVRFERMDGQSQQGQESGQAQRTGMVTAFTDVDRDRNRTLSRDEFNTFGNRVYSGWDGNRDKRLERNEFYGGMYGLWDSDRDDRLTEAEYDQAWGTWGRDVERVEFSRFDRNRDGSLDRDEFTGGWGNNGLYERWDSDRGGWLAENEFGNGLFGIWGSERNEIAENDFSPWLGRNWSAGTATTAAAAGTAARSEPAATGAVPTASRDFRISDLENMDVYNFQGKKLGEVKRLVRGIADNKQFVILEHGGFLGLGEKEVPLPLDRVTARGDRLYFRGLTEPELRQMPDWDMNSREYREFGDNETIRLGMSG